MLVDSSVWIDFLRGTATREAQYLVAALRARRAIWMAPPIFQEILQGADSLARFAKWIRTLGDLPILEEPDVLALSSDAAQLYARCRWQGFTPRSPNDCLIAAYAMRFNLPLLHRDQDFEQLREVEPKLMLINV